MEIDRIQGALYLPKKTRTSYLSRLPFKLLKILVLLFVAFTLELTSNNDTLGVDKGGPEAAVLNKSNREKTISVILLKDEDYLKTILEKIDGAKESIHLGFYLVKTTRSPNNPTNRILRALKKARKRGVAVQVLLERSDYNFKLNRSNEIAGKILKKNNVNVRFDLPKTQTHLKLVVIDRRFTFIGSHNLTASALLHNNELSVLIDSADIAGDALDYLSKIPRQTGNSAKTPGD